MYTSDKGGKQIWNWRWGNEYESADVLIVSNSTDEQKQNVTLLDIKRFEHVEKRTCNFHINLHSPSLSPNLQFGGALWCSG